MKLISLANLITYWDQFLANTDYVKPDTLNEWINWYSTGFDDSNTTVTLTSSGTISANSEQQPTFTNTNTNSSLVTYINLTNNSNMSAGWVNYGTLRLEAMGEYVINIKNGSTARDATLNVYVGDSRSPDESDLVYSETITANLTIGDFVVINANGIDDGVYVVIKIKAGSTAVSCSGLTLTVTYKPSMQLIYPSTARWLSSNIGVLEPIEFKPEYTGKASEFPYVCRAIEFSTLTTAGYFLNIPFYGTSPYRDLVNPTLAGLAGLGDYGYLYCINLKKPGFWHIVASVSFDFKASVVDKSMFKEYELYLANVDGTATYGDSDISNKIASSKLDLYSIDSDAKDNLGTQTININTVYKTTEFTSLRVYLKAATDCVQILDSSYFTITYLGENA